MAWLIVVAVITLPVVEIMVWIKAAGIIGGWATIGLSIAAVMIGAAILRRQGVAMLLDARARMEQGEVPLQAVFDGLCLAAAGFLLILPGFVTDALAVLLLLAPVRAGLRRWAQARMVVVQTTPSGPVTIDGDYTIVDYGADSGPPDSTKRLER